MSPVGRLDEGREEGGGRGIGERGRGRERKGGSYEDCTRGRRRGGMR